MKSRSTRLGAFLRAYFFLSIAAFLIAITCFSLVQGLLAHLSANTMDAFLFYFAGWVSLGAGILLFLKGKRLLRAISVPMA